MFFSFLAFVSRFSKRCFLRSRCSMEMWCLDDTGRVGPGREHASTPQRGVEAPRMLKRASPDRIIVVVVSDEIKCVFVSFCFFVCFFCVFFFCVFVLWCCGAVVSGVRCQVSSVKSGVRCQVSGVRCQVSGVRCQVSGVRCQVSGVRCQVSGVRLCCAVLCALCCALCCGSLLTSVARCLALPRAYRSLLGLRKMARHSCMPLVSTAVTLPPARFLGRRRRHTAA